MKSMAKHNKSGGSRKSQNPVSPVARQVAKASGTTSKAQGKSAVGWEPSGWWRYALIAMVVAAVCYWPSLKNDFVNWDDDVNLIKNPNLLKPLNGQVIRDIFSLDKGAVIGNYNPMPILTFALEKAVVGKLDPWVVHLNNVLLHALTVFFVFRLLVHLGMQVSGSFFGALLFAIHPMRVESVAWATERKDVLFAVFFFAALMYYVRWVNTEDRRKRMSMYVLMVVLAVLSGFSKVQAVTLPLSMLAIDYWLRRPIQMGLIWEKAPFWAVSLVFGLINLYTLREQGSTVDDVGHFSFLDRLCIGAYSFLVYLYKLVLPYPMSPLYPYPKPLPIWVYGSPIGFAGVAYLMWRAWKSDRRIWVFGMLFFFFNVMFLLQVLGAGQGFLADRFTYVPYFGFFAIGAWYFDQCWREESRRLVLQLGAGLLLLVYAVYTYRQIGIWKNGYTLWTHVIKWEGDKNPNHLPFWNRAQYLRDNGQVEQSMTDFDRAISISPENAELYNSRGKGYFDASLSDKSGNRRQEYAIRAVEDYTKALSFAQVKPKTRAEMLINRGAAQASMGFFDQATADLSEGLSLDPDNKNGYLNRSLVYYTTRQFQKAMQDYTEYLRLDPMDANVWYERGMIRRAMRMDAEALSDLNRAIQLNPNLHIAYLERARAHAQAGNKSAARVDYQRAQQGGLQLSTVDMDMMKQ
jgi:tetratricopeptide (TPR) repeat protein